MRCPKPHRPSSATSTQKDRVERIRFDPSAHLFAYKVRLDNDDEIMFSQNGAWTDIESADGIPMKLIPQQVADYVKNKYPGQTVTDIGLERNGISVRLADRRSCSSIRTNTTSGNTWPAHGRKAPVTA